MDVGAFIKSGYTVEPGDGGSFIVVRGGLAWNDGSGVLREMRGFSNWRDLLSWLQREHSGVDERAQQAVDPKREHFVAYGPAMNGQ